MGVLSRSQPCKTTLVKFSVKIHSLNAEIMKLKFRGAVWMRFLGSRRGLFVGELLAKDSHSGCKSDKISGSGSAVGGM